MPLYKPSRQVLPNPAVGQYFPAVSGGATTTSLTLGNGTLRLTGWLIETPITIDRIAVNITVAGESGARVRPGIYADSGSGYPGALLLDGGQLAADAVAAPEATVAITLSGLVWIGGAVQAAPTTQPTVTVTTNLTPPVPASSSTLSSVAGAALAGYSQTGVTGALPANFTASPGFAGNAPRVIVRRA